MANRFRSGAEYAGGIFGLLLILMVGKLANVAYRAQGPRPWTTARFLARRAIDGIFAIGWLVDRMAGYPSVVSMQGSIAANRSVMTQQ
jgi:hypothetical protein